METKKLQIEEIKLAELIPAEYNPRKNSRQQQEALKKSLQKFGLVEPIIVNRNPERYNIIVGGHFRVQELKKLKRETVECVVVNLSREDEKELNLRLNANTGDWDYDLLYKNFTLPELTTVDFNFNVLEKEASDLIERYGIIKETEQNEKIEFVKDNKRNIKQGDIFILKNPKNNTEHRVMCGDSLIQENIDKLMQGKKANMIFTDPPYNLNVSIVRAKKRFRHHYI